MSKVNVFELVTLIKAANGDPSAMTDAIWEAGYRQPERTAEEAAIAKSVIRAGFTKTV